MTNPAPIEMIAFDFDGTITTKDTFALFLRYWAGAPKWALNLLLLIPIFLLYTFKIVDRNAVKRHVIKRFFKNARIDYVNRRAYTFAKDVIPGLIRDGAKTALKVKNQPPYTLYIVSASIGPYLRVWAKDNGISHVIATELEFIDGICTGQIDGPNCWGQGKMVKIAANMAKKPYFIAEAYGDSPGDEQMLNAADVSYYRPFRL